MPIRGLISALVIFASATSCLCQPPRQDQSAVTDAEPRRTLSKTVNLAIWSNYITEEMIQEFQEKTGIAVEMTNYSSNEELLAKIQAGATGFDVVVPSDYMVETMIGLNLLEPLKRETLTNFAGLDPNFLKKGFDAENKFSVPYTYSLSGIATSTDLYAKPITSWSDIFNNEEITGKLSMMDDVREAIGAALKMQGKSLNSTDETELAQAKEALMALRSRVKAYTSEPLDSILRGDFAVSHMYSSDALQARRQTNGKIQFFLPKEGTTLAIDTLVIPKGAQHVEEAHAFINYLISPEANLKFVQSLLVGPVVASTKPLLPPELQSDPILFPPQEVLDKCEMMVDVGDATETYDRIWTEIKASTN